MLLVLGTTAAVLGCTSTDARKAPGLAETEMAAAPSWTEGPAVLQRTEVLGRLGVVDRPYAGDEDPYGPGDLTVSTVSVASGTNGAPTDMEIHAPTTPGRYAVVVFQHGFMLSPSYYGEMLSQVASHGFVVVAPRMYDTGGLPLGKPTSGEEADLAEDVLDWLPSGLPTVVGVETDTSLVGLAGHSRGAKVVWTVLGRDSGRALAAAGLDPVDGTGGPLGGEERVLDGATPLPMPVLVVGTGLGPVSTGLMTTACAPDGDNHEEFWNASASPAWHVVATDYGHQDMLDDTTPGCTLTCSLCPSGPDRIGMRTLSAGLLTAFFRDALQGVDGATSIIEDPAAAPVTVVVESR